MISATDSFVQYLSTRLAGAPPVSYLRVSASDPQSATLKMDTLNVSVLGFKEAFTSIEQPLVSLDLIGSDERQVMDWAKTVRNVLLEQQYTPELDYEASPSAPPSLSKLVSWDARVINFQVVRSSTRAFHLNATFSLSHVRQ